MTTEFLRLYRELEKITPTTAYDEGKLTRQRNDVMHRLGHKGVGGQAGEKYTRGAKYHGIRAREGAHDARQEALLGNSKAKAATRMQVHEAVHSVARLTGLAKELSTYVKAKKPVPSVLMRKLVGNDAMRRKLPPLEEGGPKESGGRLATTMPREPRDSRRDYTANSWSIEERALLNRLYLELPKPTVVTKLDSWRVFYDIVCTRFVAFYPHRSLEESIAKLQDMINRRAMKEVGEAEYWAGLQAGTAGAGQSSSPPQKASQSLLSLQRSASSTLTSEHGRDSNKLVSGSLSQSQTLSRLTK